MSENKNGQKTRNGMGGPGGGPMGSFARGPVVKAKDFKGTLKRLLNYLKPQRISFILVFIFAILDTIFTIVGPKISGEATTKLFEGLMAKFTVIGHRMLCLKLVKVVVFQYLA